MIAIAHTVGIVVPGLDRSQIEKLFGQIGDELIARQGNGSSLLDHSVSVDLGTKKLEISITVQGSSEIEAEALADFYIKDVVQATGGILHSARELTSAPNTVQNVKPFSAKVHDLKNELVSA